MAQSSSPVQLVLDVGELGPQLPEEAVDLGPHGVDHQLLLLEVHQPAVDVGVLGLLFSFSAGLSALAASPLEFVQALSDGVNAETEGSVVLLGERKRWRWGSNSWFGGSLVRR